MFETIQVGPATISSSTFLWSLGLPFETSITSKEQLIIDPLKEKLRRFYEPIARNQIKLVKCQFDMRSHGQQYNAFLLSLVMLLIPFWKLFPVSHKKKIWSLLFGFYKYFLLMRLCYAQSATTNYHYYLKNYITNLSFETVNFLLKNVRQRSKKLLESSRSVLLGETE